MSSVPEEPDREAIALIEKLRPEPQRDPQAAANGKSKFLAEARAYRASVSAEREQRHMGRKENTMRFARIPIFLLAIAVVGVVALSMLMMSGPIVGNTFSTINSSLNSVGAVEAAPTQQGYSMPNPQPTSGAAIPAPPSAEYGNQKVIKNADIRLLVEDTDRALDGLTQTVTDVRGYVISSRTWYQNYRGTNYKYATVTIGVPVDQFENAMRRLRRLGVQVLDENASGQDVTDQYVDLQSQVTNLEATRDRVKSFLDQAKTVDDVLRIDLELSRVEAQIEQLKGQMNYLSNRSAFSTITINLEPQLPKIQETPIPTATATPVSALSPWDAGKTTRQATYTLVSVYRLVADFLIWFFVVIVPVFGPPVVLIWLVGWLLRRRKRTAAKGQGA